MPASSQTPSIVLPLALLLVTGLGCGPTSRRDLGAMPQRHITYDDMCHLQDYFDQRAAGHATPFHADNEQQTETTHQERDEQGQMHPVIVGEGTYIIADHTDRMRLNRLLHDEYDHLPSPLHVTRAQTDVRLHVAWWQSASIRRLRPDVDVELIVNNETHALPFNPCVGEFLFGASAYAMRRNFLDADSARARGEIPTQYLDGGVVDGTAESDGAGGTDAASRADAAVDVPADILIDVPTDIPGDLPVQRARHDAGRRPH